MHGLMGAVLHRLDARGAAEVMDTHAELTAGWSGWRRELGLLPMVARALRQRLGLAPGSRLAEVLESAYPWSVMLAGAGAAALLAGELVPVNRGLWKGDPALPGAFITTGPALYIPMILLALATAAGLRRIQRLLAVVALVVSVLLRFFGDSTPWSRPPQFIIVLLLCAALAVLLTPPAPYASAFRSTPAALAVAALAMTALAGAVGFAERYCAVCMYRGGGPIAAVGNLIPWILLLAVGVATMVGISRGDVLAAVAKTLVVLAPWTLTTLSAFAFRSERMFSTLLVLLVLGVVPVVLANLLERRRATAVTVAFLLVAGGLAFKVTVDAFSGVVPGRAVFSTPTFGGTCIERRSATELTWGEIVVQPNASMVVEAVAVESATALTMGESFLVPLRVVNGGYTVLGDARGYPPRADDVRRTTVDWAHRMPAAGAQLAAGQWYVLAAQLRLGDPSVTSELHEVAVTYTQSGVRSALLAMGEIRVPPQGDAC